jgi:hypothetical protein
MHLPDQDLAGLGGREAAFPRGGQASSVPGSQCAFRIEVHPAPGEVDVSERREFSHQALDVFTETKTVSSG